MDAKMCDKCGKYFREVNQVGNNVKSVWENKPGVHITIVAFTKTPFTRKQYDLCPKCAGKIMDFLSYDAYPLEKGCKHCGDCEHMLCPIYEEVEEEEE